MQSCSVTRDLQIVPGCIDDYKKLAHYHYRDSRLGPFTDIYVLRPTARLYLSAGTETLGVIVYTMPSPGLELRNVATGNMFCGFDRSTRLALINKTVRCIGRVIIEPRFRGLGLASRLVRETMPLVGCAIVEAMAVMGFVNPFFEKAGMRAYKGPMPARCIQMIEAFSMVGIEEEELIDAGAVQRKIESLCSKEGDFIEGQMRSFLQSYGKRRYDEPGLQRTRLVLSKLTFRPVYYIWFNKEAAVSG